MRQPTVYLDFSTLADAFHAIRNPTQCDHAHKALHTLVERVAQEGRLYVSPVHVSELLAWHPKESSVLMARWLDSLNPAWVCRVDAAKDLELRWWLHHQIGIPQGGTYTPFVPDLQSAYQHTDPYIVNTIEAFARSVHDDPSGSHSKAYAVQRFRDLHDDRTQHAHVPETQASQLVQLMFRAQLVTRAQNFRLQHQDGRAVDDADLPPIVDRLLADSRSIPFNRLSSTIIRNLATTITTQDSGSARFHSRYSSMGYDIAHLLGGAYCDVFTCDYRVDCAIDNLRESFGLVRQLSIQRCGGLPDFVTALLRHIDGAG